MLLYAGNLDAYQGLDDVLRPLANLVRRHPRLTLLLATQSPARAFVRRADAAGLAGHVVRAQLANECDRRLVHAASDLAPIPRGAPGGLPIKLLDALARGVPVDPPARGGPA